uniref:Uncharacterized protein n=1 Tax=Anguilla anguilla TaxID=7936 RepID=A0A0E9V9G4_ANGAN
MHVLCIISLCARFGRGSLDSQPCRNCLHHPL